MKNLRKTIVLATLIAALTVPSISNTTYAKEKNIKSSNQVKMIKITFEYRLIDGLVLGTIEKELPYNSKLNEDLIPKLKGYDLIKFDKETKITKEQKIIIYVKKEKTKEEKLEIEDLIDYTKLEEILNKNPKKEVNLIDIIDENKIKREVEEEQSKVKEVSTKKENKKVEEPKKEVSEITVDMLKKEEKVVANKEKENKEKTKESTKKEEVKENKEVKKEEVEVKKSEKTKKTETPKEDSKEVKQGEKTPQSTTSSTENKKDSKKEEKKDDGYKEVRIELKDGKIGVVRIKLNKEAADIHKRLINEYRESKSLKKLKDSDELDKIAEIRVAEITYQQLNGEIISHRRPNGDNLPDVITNFDGENITNLRTYNKNYDATKEYPKKAFNNFKNSPAHDENMLKDEGDRKVGVAIAEAISEDGKKVFSAVQVYGKNDKGNEEYKIDKEEVDRIKKEAADKLKEEIIKAVTEFHRERGEEVTVGDFDVDSLFED